MNGRKGSDLGPLMVQALPRALVDGVVKSVQKVCFLFFVFLFFVFLFFVFLFFVFCFSFFFFVFSFFFFLFVLTQK